MPTMTTVGGGEGGHGELPDADPRDAPHAGDVDEPQADQQDHRRQDGVRHV